MAIWQHKSGATLAQVMGLLPDGTKPLPEPILTIIKGILWHSTECNLTRSAHKLNPQQMFKDYTSAITTKSPRGQSVNSLQSHQWPPQYNVLLTPTSRNWCGGPTPSAVDRSSETIILVQYCTQVVNPAM